MEHRSLASEPAQDTLDSGSDINEDELDEAELTRLIAENEQRLASLRGEQSARGIAPPTPADPAALQQALEEARKKYDSARADDQAIREMSQEYGPEERRVQQDEEARRASLAELNDAARVMETERGGSGDLDEDLERLFTERRRKEKSLDVCFLVDNTGSMEWCIEAIKTKLGGILDIVTERYPNALLRLAYVGYRDHGDVPKMELMPFTEPGSGEEPVKALKARLRRVKAFGGGDGPEDVVGGLQQAALLEWKSGTRLVIHFGDYPCHGRKYTDLPDDYPNGDPQGLTCEQFLAQLAAKRVDYHFARITDRTDRMIDIWRRDVFANALGCVFEVHDSRAEAEDFVPVVLRSISSSMSRSSYFSAAAAADGGGAPGAGPSRPGPAFEFGASSKGKGVGATVRRGAGRRH